ncbi:MAG: glutamate synthase [Deltaproteobacteria bacterium]|nr:glutamate synthase [Deltaproteobacteria bacterium]
MVSLDISGMNVRQVNARLKELMAEGQEVEILHPGSIHNFATGIKGNGSIVVRGSTGFYTGGFLQGPSMVIEGNTGLYTGDNMGAGEIIVERNTGMNLAPSQVGGTVLVRGNTGSRAAFGMKGGNLIVCGDVGMRSGQMTLGGRMIFLGKVGPEIGESMYNGVIHVADPEVDSHLGGNVTLKPITSEEHDEVARLFEKYGIAQDVGGLQSIVPKVYGRHDYVMFKPSHLTGRA